MSEMFPEIKMNVMPPVGIDLKPAILRESDIKGILEDTQQTGISFGVSYLDAALTKMLPTDLILLGGKPKQGKSQLAVEISKSNAIQGRRVVHIALEAEPNEVEMRLKYQLLASLFYKYTRGESGFISFREWRLGMLQEVLRPYEEEAIHLFTTKYITLETVYQQKGFSAKHLTETLDRVKDYADLIVLDHLHFMRLDRAHDKWDAQSELMMQIRELNLYYKKPFLVLAHLRKENFELAPDTDSFMGSSDLGKIATGCIMVARNNDFTDPSHQTFETILSIPACRTGPVPLVGVHRYLLPGSCYSLDFDLARVSGFKEKQKLERIREEDWPHWAKKERRWRRDS